MRHGKVTQRSAPHLRKNSGVVRSGDRAQRQTAVRASCGSLVQTFYVLKRLQVRIIQLANNRLVLRFHIRPFVFLLLFIVFLLLFIHHSHHGVERGGGGSGGSSRNQVSSSYPTFCRTVRTLYMGLITSDAIITPPCSFGSAIKQ